MELDYKLLDEKKKYLVAVSGGPDSMYLLCFASKFANVIAAHVNYNKRDSAIRDQKIVEDFCKKNGIELFIHSVDEQVTGNFQEKARELRYKWFAKLAKENGCDAILIGQHKDDVIETYLMQVERKSQLEHYGIAPKTKINNATFIRPMLDVYKADVIKMLKYKKISYGIDETNLEDCFQRNVVRKQVEMLSLKEKNEIVEKIEQANDQNKAKHKTVNMLYKEFIINGMINNILFSKVEYEYILLVMYKYLKKEGYIIKRINKKIISEMKSFIKKTTKPNAKMNMAGNWVFIKEGNISYIKEE